MRVLVMTRLFPNKLEPLWAPYNRQQFGALGKLCQVEVLSTVPWFPGAGLVPKSMAGRLREVPAEDEIAGLRVRHPRYFRPPALGHGAAAALYAASMWPLFRRERDRFDVLLAAWGYPDAVAAIMLARAMGLPVAVKLHGSDLNVLARMPTIGVNLRWALPRADRVLAVSRPLAHKAMELGARPERTKVLMDGVDGSLFHVRDRAEERRALGLPIEGRVVVYVGNLLKEKGVDDLVQAFERLSPGRPDLTLAIVGQGPLKETLEARAANLHGRLRVVGPRPHAEIARWIGASDLLTLPSWNEGTPSVLLESLASGRPVVMSAVGGIPDLVDRPLFGELVKAKDVDALVAALDRVSRVEHDARLIAAESGLRDWSESAGSLLAELEAAVAAHRAQA